MLKPILALSALALASYATQQERYNPIQLLKEEAMTIEFTATANEAVLRIGAESEVELKSLQIRNPENKIIFEMRARRAPEHALSGFEVEMQEATAPEVFAAYPEGEYDIRGRTLDGKLALGRAHLSHELPLAPEVYYPYEGAFDVPVSNLTLSWMEDRSVEGYVVNLEQGETDGLTVKLPPGTDSFTVPDGILLPGTLSQFELGAIGANGNCTLVEVYFFTE